MRTSLFLPIILLFSILLFSCQREPNLNPSPTDPAPTNTTGLVATAKYNASTQVSCRYQTQDLYYNEINDDYYIGFRVNVTQIGTWIASTDSVNGLKYMGTGSFSTPGENYMLLKAYGMPIKRETATYTMLLGKDTCRHVMTPFQGGAQQPPSPLPNRKPITNAGCDILITAPTNSIKLTGTAVDGDGTITAYQWRNILSASLVTIPNANQPAVTVNNLVQGVYQFELKATDNQGASTLDTMQVLVQPSGSAIYAPIDYWFCYCVSDIVSASGLFITNLPISPALYVTAALYVTSPGKWSLSTKIVNGFSFSGSGIFTTLGINYIRLYASGTPIAVGAYRYAFNEFPGSSVIAYTGNSLPTANAKYYYKATIGGEVQEAYVISGTGYMAGSGKGEINNTANLSADISPEPNTTLLNSTTFEVTKGLIANYSSVSNGQFHSFFGPGNYPYATGPNTNPVTMGNGISIIWKDKNGELWSTSYGSRDQMGSTFLIQSTIDEPDPVGTLYVKVKATFSCKLYNSAGQMKLLTNGEFVGLFGKI